MLNRKKLQDIISRYDSDKLKIGVLGSHSALDVCDGATDEGFETFVVCQKGREGAYRSFGRICSRIEVLDKFSQISRLRATMVKENVIFVPNRAFSAYCGYDFIEKEFAVPMFGSRFMLRSEERTARKNQYHILDKAGIRKPKIFSGPQEIDRLVMVKVPEAERKFERGFFTASSPGDFLQKSEQLMKSGIISRESLKGATIEEFVLGTYFNFNYFYSPLKREVEFMGIDRRLQSNLHDFVNMPARQQLALDGIPIRNIEVGHTPATVRESLLEKVFDLGARFARASEKMFPPGIIGPFCLQSIVTPELDIVVYDVSPRMPGAGVLGGVGSPYTKYHFGRPVSPGRRISMEIKKAAESGLLGEIVT